MSQVAPVMHRAPVVPEQRKTFSPKVRAEVLLKSKGRCAGRSCGVKIRLGGFEVDHIDELWEGGSNDIENLQALCPDCHKAKTAKGRGRQAKATAQGKACLPRDPAEIEPGQIRGRGFPEHLTKGVNGKVRPRKHRPAKDAQTRQLGPGERAEGVGTTNNSAGTT